MTKLDKIKAIQKAIGTEDDGIIGPATLEAIYLRVVSSSPPAVDTAQLPAPRSSIGAHFQSNDPQMRRIFIRFLNLAENDSGSPETDYKSVYVYKDGNNDRQQVTLGVATRRMAAISGKCWPVTSTRTVLQRVSFAATRPG